MHQLGQHASAHLHWQVALPGVLFSGATDITCHLLAYLVWFEHCIVPWNAQRLPQVTLRNQAARSAHDAVHSSPRLLF